MRSLQWRMVMALGFIILVAWAISISMLLSYLSQGAGNVWDDQLHVVGDALVALLPQRWVASAVGVAADQGARTNLREILTALALNTLQLAVVGLLMSWAIRGSLRPLARISQELGRRDTFATVPLPAAEVPVEIRPLILSFNTLLGRVNTAMQAEHDFIADAAHELRTPLSAVHAHAEIALRAPTLEQKDAALRKLLQVSRRSTRLAEQLLDLARLDAGLHAPALERADLYQLAAHVIGEFSVEAGSRGVDIQLHGVACPVRCDVDEIGVLLRNLVDNALRYGREHGRIEVHCGYFVAQGERRPFLEVVDEGEGVPADKREAIFQRFYRVPGSQARGSGIGLSLVAGIAKLHHAVIETREGSHGQGFSVRVIFPHDA